MLAENAHVIVVPDSTVWLIDAPPHGWTVGNRHLDVRALGHENIVNGGARPDSAFYLAMPNGNNDRALTLLSNVYDVIHERQYEHDGYALSRYRLTLKRRPEP
jgi:hypothetical protein